MRAVILRRRTPNQARCLVPNLPCLPDEVETSPGEVSRGRIYAFCDQMHGSPSFRAAQDDILVLRGFTRPGPLL